MANLVGWSMSRCIRDIYFGKVSIDDVVVIECGTMVSSFESLNDLVTSYIFQGVWKGMERDKIFDILEPLLFTGRIRQERVMKKNPNYLERSVKRHREGGDDWSTFDSTGFGSWTPPKGDNDITRFDYNGNAVDTLENVMTNIASQQGQAEN